MSFLISVYVNEGIVLASDRRITYTNTQIINGKLVEKIGIHNSDSTDKTFIYPNGAGISVCGNAILLNKPITGFILNMIRTKISEKCEIEDIPQIIINYFNALEEIPNTDFIVAGYDTKHKERQLIYTLNVKTKDIEKIDTTLQGAIWKGEASTFTRLINNVALKTKDGTYKDLPVENILFEFFTLQDAVDFARYAVETTIQTMRFKNVVETVGGDVDILVITPNETKWLQKKNLF